MTPPHSTTAERHVLGVCMTWPDRVDEVSDFVEAGDFYTPAHGPVFESIVRLAARGSSTDAGAVADDMRTHGTLDDAGGPGVLVALVDGAPTQAGVVDSAKRVAETARVRSVITAAQDVAYRGMNGDYGDAGEFCDGAEAQVMDASKGRRVVDAVPMGQVVREQVRWLEQLDRDGGQAIGVSTGFDDLDEWTCGLNPGELVIVAAATSVGKTSFATSIAVNAGVPFALFSMEQDRAQIALRLISSLTDMPTYQLRAPRFWGRDGATKIIDAARELSACKVWVDDRPRLTTAMIHTRTRRLIRSHGIAGVVVDHLGFCRPAERIKDGRTREVSAMTGELKAMALDLGVPVIVLAHLNRLGSNVKPELWHLKDSGSIEQDCDKCILLWRPEKGLKGKDEAEHAEVILGKNRQGPLGTSPATWNPRLYLFTPPDHGPDVATLPEKDPLDGLVED